MMELLRMLASDQDDLPQCPPGDGTCNAALVTRERVHHCVIDPHDSAEHGCSCGADWSEVVEPAANEE